MPMQHKSSAGSKATGSGCGTPQVSADDLFSFHEAHFSDAAVAQFRGTFLTPLSGHEYEEEYACDGTWEEEDDLGYYSDGAKRTLTDEQIEIFRHSELQSLRRQQEKDAAKSKHAENSGLEGVVEDSQDAPGLSKGSLPTAFQSNKRRKKKNAARHNVEPKPDLRKRTWDVVEKGVDTLDYD